MKVRFEGAVKNIYGNVLIYNITRDTRGVSLAQCKSRINYNIKTKDCGLSENAKIILDGKWTILEY